MKSPNYSNSNHTSFKVNFNENQLLAVSHVGGPMMVLAGPGSGKTAVITGRLENMTVHMGILPENILVVSFSKKAALELKSRFLKEGLSPGQSPVFGTFHSIFYRIINTESGTSLKVISEKQKYTVIRTALESVGVDFEDNADFFFKIISEISKVKGNVLDINGYAPASVPADIFRFIYRKYNAHLYANNLVDFDDMQLKCLRLLSSNRNILEKWQEKFPYILIDEFQDINLVQYEIMRLLSGSAQNIFIVGDDDQSIYGFRGARPELMRRFLKDFPAAKQLSLKINYRSTPEIVKAAGLVIKENEFRFKKDIHPFKKSFGNNIRMLEFSDIKAESAYIISQIKSLKKQGLSLCDIALLYRNNAETEYIKAQLKKEGLNVSGDVSLQSPYGHFIARDIFSYIRAAYLYPACRLTDILMIMNKPSRYISRSALSIDEHPFACLKGFYAGNKRMLSVTERFEKDIIYLKSLPPYAAVKYIRNVAGYDDFLKEYEKETGLGNKNHADVLKKIEADALNFNSLSSWLSFAEKQMNEGGPHKNNDDSAKKGNALSIMTIHASKGLEWEAVFIPTCCDSIIPGRNSRAQSALEEERRILYVAMTRAKSFLYISYVKEMHGKNALPCRFLESIKKGIEI